MRWVIPQSRPEHIARKPFALPEIIGIGYPRNVSNYRQLRMYQVFASHTDIVIDRICQAGKIDPDGCLVNVMMLVKNLCFQENSRQGKQEQNGY